MYGKIVTTEEPGATTGGAYGTNDLRKMSYNKISGCLDEQMKKIRQQLNSEGLGKTEKNNLNIQLHILGRQMRTLEDMNISDEEDKKKPLNDYQIRQIAKLNYQLKILQNSYKLLEEQNINR